MTARHNHHPPTPYDTVSEMNQSSTLTANSQKPWPLDLSNGLPDTRLTLEFCCTESATVRITPVPGAQGQENYLEFIHPVTKAFLKDDSGLGVYVRSWVDDEKYKVKPNFPGIYHIHPTFRYEVWFKAMDRKVAVI